MLAEKNQARTIGILFIIATAAAALSQVVLGPSLDDANYLTGLSADATRVRIAALLDLVTAAAVVAIPVMLHPVLKKHSATISVAYLTARVLEAAVIIVGAVNLLALLRASADRR